MKISIPIYIMMTANPLIPKMESSKAKYKVIDAETVEFMSKGYDYGNSGDRWTVRVQNNSSVENPDIILDFKKMYVHDKIRLTENGMGRCTFSTKTTGYRFCKVIVPEGMKAEASGYFCDFDMDIVISNE